MEKFKKLSKAEMKKISGGQVAACSVDCGGFTLECNGESCGGSDGVGCYSVTGGEMDIWSCDGGPQGNA